MDAINIISFILTIISMFITIIQTKKATGAARAAIEARDRVVAYRAALDLSALSTDVKRALDITHALIGGQTKRLRGQPAGKNLEALQSCCEEAEASKHMIPNAYAQEFAKSVYRLRESLQSLRQVTAQGNEDDIRSKAERVNEALSAIASILRRGLDAGT